MGVQALFLNVQFGNSVGSEGLDILIELLSKFQPIEMLLQHFHCIFDAEVSRHSNVVGFPYQLHSLS
jgi:hypothetical protein